MYDQINVPFETRKSFFHKAIKAGFWYIFSNQPWGLGYTPAAHLGSSIARLRLLSLINSKRNAVFSSDKNNEFPRASFPDSDYYKKKSGNYKNYAVRLHSATCQQKKSTWESHADSRGTDKKNVWEY